LQFVHVFKTHSWQLSHHSIHFFLPLIQLSHLVFISLLQTRLHMSCPNHLYSQKSYLWLVLINKVLQWHCSTVFSSLWTHSSHWSLHFLLQLVQPVFYVSFSSHTLYQRYIFKLPSNSLWYLVNKSSIAFFKINFSDSIEQLLEIVLYCIRVWSYWKDL
jgi:hypothetical protein